MRKTKSTLVTLAVILLAIPGSARAEELLGRLEKAYEAGSKEQLIKFFEDWHKAVPAKGLDKLDNAAVKDVYAVYREFFRPLELDKIGKSEWGSGIYKNVKYVIVQGSVRYSTGDFEKRKAGTGKTEEQTISKFRPPLESKDVKPVYLSDEYQKALLAFLGSERVPAGAGNIMAPARAKGESAKRLAFLNQLVKIHHGHWGGWHLETHPKASSVLLNSDRTQAIVHFRIVYQGGQAELAKENGRWKLKRSRLTWIE